MLIKSPFGGGTASGKLGPHVFLPTPNGQGVRMYVKPVFPETPRQVLVNEIMKQLSNDWNINLNEAQRAGWIAYAKATPMGGKIGNSRPLSGRAQFIRTAFIPTFIPGLTGGSHFDPPTTPGIIPSAIAIYGAEAGSSQVSLDAINPLGATLWGALFLVSRPRTAAVAFFKGPFDFTESITDGDMLPVELALIPGMKVGDRLWIHQRFYDVTLNKVSQPVINQITITP